MDSLDNDGLSEERKRGQQYMLWLTKEHRVGTHIVEILVLEERMETA